MTDLRDTVEAPTMDEQELFRVRPIRLAVIRALQEIGAQWRRDRITEQYLAASR